MAQYSSIPTLHTCNSIVISVFQSAQYSPDVLLDYTELLLECLPLRMHWKPVSDFIKLDGITLILRLIAIADEWTQYTGK
jgi:hypothetical protein